MYYNKFLSDNITVYTLHCAIYELKKHSISNLTFCCIPTYFEMFAIELKLNYLAVVET